MGEDTTNDGQHPARREGDAQRIEVRPLDYAAKDAECPRIEGLIGESPKLRELLAAVYRASQFDYNLLLVGPTGTGKTVIARAVVGLSKRRDAPFIEVNSAAFQDELVESNLFGHARGAFTGATADKKGLFEAADGGTIFFDEIGDMPARLQAKVLKVIESGTITRVGETKARPCNVRIIYATCQNLIKMVREGTFREDLLHRINALRIIVPTLDERREDIPALVHYFLERERKQYRREEPFEVEDAAMHILGERDWPGNVRELELAIQRLVVAAFDQPRITLENVLDVTSANLDIAPVGEREADIKFIHVPPFQIGGSVTLYLSRVLLYIYNTLITQTDSHTRVATILRTDRNALSQLIERHRLRLEKAKEAATVLKPRREGGQATVHNIERRRRQAR